MAPRNTQQRHATSNTHSQGSIGMADDRGQRPRRKSAREIAEDSFKAELSRAARYLVTKDGYIVAAFADQDDAIMFESELADVDKARGNLSEGTTCEVLDRRGRRLAGYWVSGGRIMSYLRDDRPQLPENMRAYGSRH